MQLVRPEHQPEFPSTSHLQGEGRRQPMIPPGGVGHLEELRAFVDRLGPHDLAHPFEPSPGRGPDRRVLGAFDPLGHSILENRDDHREILRLVVVASAYPMAGDGGPFRRR